MVMSSMKDNISWVKSSKIQRKIDTYNDNIDDHDANNYKNIIYIYIIIFIIKKIKII